MENAIKSVVILSPDSGFLSPCLQQAGGLHLTIINH